MKEYKAIFIDWDDTIGDFQHAADVALHDIYKEFRLSEIIKDEETFIGLYKPHNVELWLLYVEDKVTKEFLSIDRFLWPLVHGMTDDEAMRKVLYDSPRFRELAERISNSFLELTTHYFSLLPGAEELVRRLAAKYPLTVVSNGFVEVQYEKFRKSGLETYFSHIILSEEVGAQKPNPKIFQIALEKNALKKDEVLMIGDAYTSDIVGAAAAGIDQLWIRSKGTKPSNGQVATYIVYELDEIYKLLSV